MGKRKKHTKDKHNNKRSYNCRSQQENEDTICSATQTTVYNGSMPNPSPKALIYYSELQYIARCIQDYPNIETGGQLFGAWTASGAPRIMYAIGPGPRANHQPAFFNQDIEYLQRIGAKLKEFGLQHIGEWHSHHILGLASPSGHDARTMQNGVDDLNLHRLCLCIGNIDKNGFITLNPFNFARGARYVDASWEIISTENHLRESIDKYLEGEIMHPKSVQERLSNNLRLDDPTINENVGWFSNSENRRQFKMIIDWIEKQKWVKKVRIQMAQDGRIILDVRSDNFVQQIIFPRNFPNESFIANHRNFSTDDSFVSFNCKDWEYTHNEPIFDSFKNNYINFVNSINGSDQI